MDAEVPIKTVHAKRTGVGAVAFFVGKGFEGVEVDGGQVPASGVTGGAHVNCLGRIHFLSVSSGMDLTGEREAARGALGGGKDLLVSLFI